MGFTKEQVTWSVLRIFLGLVFFWAFVDKLFGLGFSTKPEKAWLAGGSPTLGFLTNSPKGPFVDIYHSLAGIGIVDWLFMIGLCCIGLSLILGIGLRIAGYSGALLMLLMWAALIPPANHPFLDDHIIYAGLLLGFSFLKVGRELGLGEKWSSLALVKKYPILE